MLYNQNQVVLSTKNVYLNVIEKDNYFLKGLGWVQWSCGVQGLLAKLNTYEIFRTQTLLHQGQMD